MQSFSPLLVQQPNGTWAKLAAVVDDAVGAIYPIVAGTPPTAVTFSAAETDVTGEFIDITFSGNISALPLPAASEFLVEVDAAPVAVDEVEVTAQDTIRLTLATPVENGEAVELTYTAGTLLSLNGVAVATFGPETVTNNVP